MIKIRLIISYLLIASLLALMKLSVQFVNNCKITNPAHLEKRYLVEDQ